MKLLETKLADCFIIEPKIFGDHRGWFMESYSKSKFKELALEYDFVQDNHSYSKEKGVIRGIHFQNHPHAQSKLVRCTKGTILDVAVDLRSNSNTYMKWIAVELSEENKKQLLIPKGFGHGFLTLTDDVEVQYKTDNFYNLESDRSIRFDDPDLAISWGITNPILSEKDKTAPFLKDANIQFNINKGGK